MTIELIFILVGTLAFTLGFLAGILLASNKTGKRLEWAEEYYRAEISKLQEKLLQTTDKLTSMIKLGYTVVPEDEGEDTWVIDNEYELEVERKRQEKAKAQADLLKSDEEQLKRLNSYGVDLGEL